MTKIIDEVIEEIIRDIDKTKYTERELEILIKIFKELEIDYIKLLKKRLEII